MFSKKSIAFFILILIVSIGVVSAEDNATSQKTFNDVQTAINEANNSDVINIEGDYTGQSKQISISKNLVIEGKNATLDAKSSSRIISTKKDVTFKNITFANGINKECGGAVYSNNNTNTLTFINCKFINNQAKSTGEYDYGDGGAIYTRGSLVIINCTFINSYGNGNSAISCSGEKITITNSSFISNKGGNVIYAWANCNIENSSFINNSEAIYAVFSITAKNTNFTNNGGAISSEYNAYIDRCNFTKNINGLSSYMGEATVKNSYFNGNGNGVYAQTPCSIDNCTFINSKGYAVSTNSWTDEPVIYSMPANDIAVTNSLFKSNHGAILNSYNKLKITNCIFQNNSAEFGSSISNSGGIVTVKNSNFTNNTLASIVTVNLEDSSGYNHEGSISIDGTKYKKTNMNDSFKSIELIKVETAKVNTAYYSGAKLTIKVISINTKKPLRDITLKLKVYTGKKYKTYEIYTNSKGIATFKASTLAPGSHKVEITSTYPCTMKKATTTIKVVKAKTTVKAPKVTAKYKKSKYFKVTVKHKITKKPVKSIYLKLKIGKKTYKIKTNSKGVAKFNTKKLKKGKYTVKITTTSKYYTVSKKSKIIIKK